MRAAPLVVTLVMLAKVAWASEAFVWNVAVVVRGGTDPAFTIEQVPMVEMFDLPSCTARVAWLTTAPTAISVSGAPQNRNAANLLGATARLESPVRAVADTVVVQLDLEEIDEGIDGQGYRWLPADEIVPMTIECLRQNIRVCAYPESHYLEVQVVGDPRFESLGRVFDLSRLHN